MVELGAQIPDISVKDETGKQRRLGEFVNKSLVIWFFPKADTPG